MILHCKQDKIRIMKRMRHEMKNKMINIIIKFSSLILVLSYLIFENIYLVIIGIIIALYEIYKNTLNSFFRNNFSNINKEELKVEKSIRLENKSTKLSQKQYPISIAHEIEELGYIPSNSMGNQNKI